MRSKGLTGKGTPPFLARQGSRGPIRVSTGGAGYSLRTMKVATGISHPNSCVYHLRPAWAEVVHWEVPVLRRFERSFLRERRASFKQRSDEHSISASFGFLEERYPYELGSADLLEKQAVCGAALSACAVFSFEVFSKGKEVH